MRPGTTDMTALLGSRICHDLISPVGAIGNGLELLSLSGLDRAPEFQLISESVRNANARIRMFRVAFGAADAEQTLGRAEIVEILGDVTESGRLSLSWEVEGQVSRTDAKLAFLLIMCAEAAMPWGGTLRVTREGQGWRLAGKARRLKVERALWDMLAGARSGAEITASVIQFPLAAAMAETSGRVIRTDITDETLSISF